MRRFNPGKFNEIRKVKTKWMGQFYLLGRKLKAVHETTVIHHLVKFQIYPPVKRFMRDDPRRLSNFTIIYEPDFSSTTSFVLSCFKSVLPGLAVSLLRLAGDGTRSLRAILNFIEKRNLTKFESSQICRTLT